MKIRFKHLSLDERDRITLLKYEGMSLRAIAKVLGRSPGTLSRKLKRNFPLSCKVYLPHKAHERAVKRKQKSSNRPRLKNERIVSYVREKLDEDWSPELIAGRITMGLQGASISPT